MPASADIQAATIQKFIEGWRGWTPEGFLSTWSDDCSQQQLPFSSQVPLRTREHVEKFFPKLMSILTNFQVSKEPKVCVGIINIGQFTLHNVVHDAPQGKAVIYAITEADSPFGPYHNEHAIFLWFDDSGEKLCKIEELFDTVVMNEFLPKIHQYLAQQEAQLQATEGTQGT